MNVFTLSSGVKGGRKGGEAVEVCSASVVVVVVEGGRGPFVCCLFLFVLSGGERERVCVCVGYVYVREREGG